ncbi:MAG: periplasmic heavy metal sensor [Alphaproteobacteria bacterium]|nr:periplasmic heavy metal sensor [Alphaproteobacteria bacterium]
MNRLATVLGGLLFLSLAGNIFMGGLMLGDRASKEVAKPADDRRAEWRKRDEELMKRLSDADRAILTEVKGKYEAEMETRRTELEAAREKLEAAHAADPVDSIAIEKAGREEALKKAELLKTVRAARKEISGRLSPEGRAEMEKMRPPKSGRHGDRRPRGDRESERVKPAPDYDQTQAPAPKDKDCGGCEVPGAETPPQP